MDVGDVAMVDHSPTERESPTDDSVSGQSVSGTQPASTSGPAKVDRYARVNERLEKAWGNAAGWAPPTDKYKFTIEDLQRAGINLRDNVSRVTAKAQRHGYQPLTKLWEPEGLFHELALETGMMRRSEDGRIVVQAKLFHRAAALADEWFAGAISFAQKADGSQRVVRKYKMAADQMAQQSDDAAETTTTTTTTTATTTTATTTTATTPARSAAAKTSEPRSAAKPKDSRRGWNGEGDAEDEEMLDVDGSGGKNGTDKARQGGGGRLRIGWDDDEPALRRTVEATPSTSSAPTPSTTTAVAKTRTPLPTNSGSRRTAPDMTRQPTTKSWTSINRPSEPARGRSPGAGSLKRHRIDDDDDSGGSSADRHDGSRGSSTTGLKRRQVARGRAGHGITQPYDEYLQDEFDLDKLGWALDYVRDAADVVAQRGRADGRSDGKDDAWAQACLALFASRGGSNSTAGSTGRAVDAAALAAATTMAAMNGGAE